MKIALFVSGLIRRNELGYEHLKKMLLEPNSEHEIDIYLDIWSNKISKFENKGAQWRQERRASLSFEDKHDLNQLYEMYNPVAFKVENDSDAKLFQSLADGIINGHEHKATPYAIYSQFYKLYSADIMKRVREEFFHFKYDMCVRTREESIYQKPIIFDSFELDENTIYVENEGYSLHHAGHGWVSDKFAICSSNTMTRYASFGQNFKVLNTTLYNKYPTTPEIYMKQYLLNGLGIKVVKDDRIGKIGRY